MRWLCLLAAGLLIAAAPPAAVTLEIRVFQGAEEVSAETRVTVHRAGDRATPLPAAGDGARHVYTVAPGIYDAQAVRERDGRVLNIRWAERLIVMAYPDERGRHLEVINFASGFGALQVRSAQPGQRPVGALFASGERTQPAADAVADPGGEYLLFVVPAGRYDLRTGSGSGAKWHADVDVPRDRTRLWVTP